MSSTEFDPPARQARVSSLAGNRGNGRVSNRTVPHIPLTDLYGIFGFPVPSPESSLPGPASPTDAGLVRRVRELAGPIETATIVTALVALVVFIAQLARGLA